MNYYGAPMMQPSFPGDAAAPRFQMSAYKDMGSSYGAAQKPGTQTAFIRGARKRMNIVAIAASLFLPWTLFSVIFAVMTFSLHYQQPLFAYFIVMLGFLVVAASGALAFDAARAKSANDPRREPTWYIFTFGTCIIAWVAAVVGGDINFYKNLQPFYDIMNLNIYPSVDPSRMRGQQLMDAGRIIFTEDTKLDITKSMGFKNLDMYCVAPITVNQPVSDMPLATYDFWAVGLNCCSGDKPDFHCGEFANPRAHAGLRLMRDDQRSFFRLAVQQAEAQSNIKAQHPLFFYWMQDPMMAVSAYQEDGFKYYLLGMFSHFVFQLFLVTCAVLIFSRMGQM
jgi:hypothetical protein